MPRILFIITLILSNFVTSAQSLSAFVDFARFSANDSVSYIELYIGINANSVVYKENEDGDFQSQVLASIKIMKDSSKITYFEKFNITSPFSKTPQPNFAKFNFSKRVFTEKAKLTCELILKDANADTKPDTVSFPFDNTFSDDKIIFSDIQLLSDYQKTDLKNDYTKGNYLLNPLTSTFLPNDFKSLKYYLEIYNLDNQLGEDSAFVLFTTFMDKSGRKIGNTKNFKRGKASETFAILSETDITKLPSGNYYFLAEVRDKKNNLISYTAKEIQRANTDFKESDAPDDLVLASNFTNSIEPEKLEHFMKSFRPIATENEMATIHGLVERADSSEMRNYFFNFWYKRHKNNAQIEWLKYRKRILIADEKYGCFGRPGYLSEQGRVYLRYGGPNLVENQFTDPRRDAGTMQKEYEVWTYYSLPDGQRNKIFVFLRSNGGNCDYDMIHSNARGELKNNAFLNGNSWRDVLRNNQNTSFNARDRTEQITTDY